VSEPLLDVRAIESFYGASQALFGVSFSVDRAEVVTLLGRNGMGKSTTVASIIGWLAPRRGQIRLAGTRIDGEPAYRIAQSGIAVVPEGRLIFPNLTVRENLAATAANRGSVHDPWTLSRVYGMFPRLQERAHHSGANLSGGEQQMLAIGRALMTNPKLLILDEATEGLAPLIRAEIWRCLARLKADGLALVVIDKNIGPLLGLADRHYILEKGNVVWSGTSAALQADPKLLHDYLGV
jgi:branched-chain amino acid transport system ATP-binding protein